jgi:CRISPR-associated protein Cmr1
MPRISLDIESLTPLFLGGADPLGEPELRPASFRGALRFWFRALYGGVIGINDLNSLRQMEEKTFGTTENGSPVIARTAADNLRSQSFESNLKGVQYLFWSVLRTRRRCLSDGSKFKLTLQTRPGEDGTEPLKRSLAALWLLTRLGGLGARSRRGAGSIQVTQPPGEETSSLFPDLRFEVRAKTPNELCDELATGLRNLRSLFEIPPVESLSLPDFDVLHPDCCRVIVVDKKWDTWQQALNEVGERFQAFRNRRSPDYGIVKDAIKGRSDDLQPVQRAAFGLPIVFYYRSLGGQQVTLEGEDHDRRASPLMIRVLRLANPRFVVALTLFDAELLDDAYDENLKLKRRGNRPAIGAPPDLGIIDEFIEELTTPGGQHYLAPRLEVNFR